MEIPILYNEHTKEERKLFMQSKYMCRKEKIKFKCRMGMTNSQLSSSDSGCRVNGRFWHINQY